MNARIAIFKQDSSFLSCCWRPIHLYCTVIVTILLGTTLLQRLSTLLTAPSQGYITSEEQRYVTAAEVLCRKLVPEVDQFQVGIVTQTLQPSRKKGFFSVQISDIADQNHFHVMIEKETKELVVFSYVLRGQATDSLPEFLHNAVLRTEDKEAQRKAAITIAKETLNVFYETGVLHYREPLGVTVEHPGDWIIQWHYRDCCIIMDVRSGEERTVAFRLRRHPRPLTKAEMSVAKRGCPYCLGFGKTPDHMYKNCNYSVVGRFVRFAIPSSQVFFS